jgi:two-component system sensor histidine kinase PilS (NtrC family)
MTPVLQNPVADPGSTFWRTLQTFSVTRVVIALVLFAYVSLNTRKSFWTGNGFADSDVCLGYLLLATLFAVIATYYRRRFLLQLLSQVALDITVISLLYIVAGGAKSGLSILYLFPLAGGAILASLVLALFFVSVVTLILLAESGYQLLQASADASISHVGLYSAAFFAAAIVINRLAGRLIKQENLATQRGHDLQVQEAINRLVIADMGDGILVVGRDSSLLTCNPAAQRMLGLSFSYDALLPKLTDIPMLTPIAEAFFAWNAHFADQAHGGGSCCVDFCPY